MTASSTSSRRASWLLGLLVLAGLVAAGCGNNQDSTADGDLDLSGVSVRQGALLYDTWWVTNGTAEPTETFPLYASTAGTQTGSITWRCKECHGWDYQGAAGAYGAGEHFTGVPGVLVRPDGRTRQELFDLIATGAVPASGASNVTAEHAFGEQLSDDDIRALVAFLTAGVVDTTPLFTDARSTGNAASGAALYAADGAGRCAPCHGAQGMAIPVGDGERISLGLDARAFPNQALHRTRFGVPGTDMPSAASRSLDLAQVSDLLAHLQTLP